jgi:hypothetical protein
MRPLQTDLLVWCAGCLILLILALTGLGLEHSAPRIVAERGVREALDDPGRPLESIIIRGYRWGQDLVCGHTVGDPARRFAVVVQRPRRETRLTAFLGNALKVRTLVVPERRALRSPREMDLLRDCAARA